MKYRKLLEQKLSIYNDENIKNCIQYKYWKKQIKKNPLFVKLFWKKLINSECKKLDKYLFEDKNEVIKKLNNQKFLLLCYINCDTLYKISKKINKKLNVNSLDYYKKLCKKNIYKFLIECNETMIDIE